MHRHTPTVVVLDPRGALVREVAYHLRSAQDAIEPRIHQHVHDAPGHRVQSRDPRFFARYERGVSQLANQATVFSLTSGVLLSDNVDAGWRLRLAGEAGQDLEDWDPTFNHLRTTYDALMRPVSEFESTSGAQRRTACFTYAGADALAARYNGCGQLVRIDDGAGSVCLRAFSLLGQCLEHRRRFLEDPQPPDWPEGEAERDALLEPQSALTRLRHNALGEATGHVDATGNQYMQRQTVGGALSGASIQLLGSDDELVLVSDIHYSIFGEIEQQTAGNGVITRATFEPETGWLQTLRAQIPGEPPLQRLVYAYDPLGNPLRISDEAQPIRFFRQQRVAAIQLYQYDTLGQLIEATGRQRVNVAYGPQLPAFVSPVDASQLEPYRQTFAYDPGGNLLTLNHHAASGDRTERTAVATASNRSLPWGEAGQAPGDDEVNAAYNPSGHLRALQRGQILQWDAHHRLRQVTQVARRAAPDDMELYAYDSDGQRVRKIRTAAAASVNRRHETRYLPALEVRSSADEVLQVISVQAGRCAVQVLHWDTGRPKGIAQDQLRFWLVDHLGSGMLELDRNGALISQELHFAYGGTAWWAGRDSVEAGYKTRRYSGRERDATGLYYYGARYYMPWRQRWLSADPGGVVDGLNLYRMVGGNPIGYVDVEGLAKVRVTPMQRVQATLAGLGRAAVKKSAGAGAKWLAKKTLQGVLGQTARYPLVVIAGAAAGFAGGRAAARVLASHDPAGALGKLPILAAGAIGFAVGSAVGFTAPDPVGVVEGIVKSFGSSTAGAIVSDIGPSLSPHIDSWRALAVTTFAKLGGNVAKGAASTMLSDIGPMVNTVVGGAIKKGVGFSVKRLGRVGDRFKPGQRHAIGLPTRRGLVAGGVLLAQKAATDLVYKLANAEFDHGLTQVFGDEASGSALREGLGGMKPVKELAAIGKYAYKERGGSGAASHLHSR